MKRREFIKNTAASSALLGLTGLSLSSFKNFISLHLKLKLFVEKTKFETFSFVHQKAGQF